MFNLTVFRVTGKGRENRQRQTRRSDPRNKQWSVCLVAHCSNMEAFESKGKQVSTGKGRSIMSTEHGKQCGSKGVWSAGSYAEGVCTDGPHLCVSGEGWIRW